MNKLLELKNIKFSYVKNPSATNHKKGFLLNETSLRIDKGSFISVIGKNGSGKSTLIKLISGILNYYEGDIFYEEKNIRSIARKDYARIVSYLPQSNNSFNEELRVKEFLLLGRYSHKNFTDFNFSNEDYEVVFKAINETDVDYLTNKFMHELSGGERQKILLTLGLVQLDIRKNLEGKILIIDEPLTYLDVSFQYEIFNILKKLNQSGLTIIIVIHDLNFALKYTGKSILMDKGKVILYSDSINVITENILKEHFLIDSKIINWGNNVSVSYLS